MKTCGKGHDLSFYGFRIKGRAGLGCGACRRDAANARWGNSGTISSGNGSRAGRAWEDRFWARVAQREAAECWLWTGARIPNGYGSLGSVEIDGRVRSQVGAHRLSFFLANGYWPRITRHTCDNPPCVNPAHLLDGDARSNARDMVDRGRCPASQRTHCPQGHEYDEANTRYTKQGHRQCRKCQNANAARCATVRMERDPEGERAKRNAYARAYKARKRAAASD